MIQTAVDLFAGLGGNTEGATRAGVRVVAAANHWDAALRVHKMNHPNTEHYLQDLNQANFHAWPDFDLMIASPACQGHSSARGKDRPHHDAARSTAWAVVACAEAKRPKALAVENVAGFLKWALYPEWRRCLEKLGYQLEENLLNAADLGVPQHRIRVFITGIHRSVSDRAVVVPNPRKPHMPASTIIDWSVGSWSQVYRAGRAPATIRRYEQGRRDHGDRFLLAYYGKERGGRSLSKPIGSVLTRDRYALVDGSSMRMLTAREYANAFGYPASYRLTGDHKTDVHLVGNSVAPEVTRLVVTSIQQHLQVARAA